jgi:hypothetical protein
MPEPKRQPRAVFADKGRTIPRMLHFQRTSFRRGTNHVCKGMTKTISVDITGPVIVSEFFMPQCFGNCFHFLLPVKGQVK